MTTLPAFCTPVPLDKAYRLLNHGPTVLVSSAHAGQHNVMAAAWSMPLDFSPPKITVVIDKATRTRALVEGSGWFALNVPARALAQATLGVGSDSAADTPDKLQRHGMETFEVEGSAVPLVQGCVGWLLCKLVPEPHNQQTYDLFIGEVTQAWADSRVFVNGHWEFDKAPDALRTLHYVAGGQFFVIGEGVKVGVEEASTPVAPLELQSLRADVDDIDAKIVGMLASRFRTTSKIGKLKALHALDAIDPQREAAQEARFRELAQGNGLNADLVVRIFRSVIDEVVSNHREAKSNPS